MLCRLLSDYLQKTDPEKRVGWSSKSREVGIVSLLAATGAAWMRICSNLLRLRNINWGLYYLYNKLFSKGSGIAKIILLLNVTFSSNKN
jgi:hypothetical protein